MSALAPTIRPLSPGDHADWLPLWRGYQHFYRVDIPAEVSEVTFGRLIAPAEPMAGALAWLDGKAVGLVHFIRHRSCWTTADYCHLQDLFVAAECRGAGLGRRLIEYVYARARELGLNRVYWLTHETNTEARQLYDRIADRSGFIQYRHLLRG